ncbi:Crp/Fnr family transcriptional regulator [Solihabitans fulvus]|uniref:Crp/Fnr family transcriptional regulator n=1 Tax=Solihabitans fulvus TaxID=1892852 RepID=A0A5B2X4P9_9PSEU|nr:Crp/Fnr family transcriptional regulator [Solihabitans fulvus]KAA2258140.1 Crp/Fnr family transcriptional regulator [Solihabitans fulvus]
MDGAHGFPNDSFWARLGPVERAVVEQTATRHVFRPRAVIFHQSEKSEHVVVLLRGHVRVDISSRRPSEVMVAVRGPGDVLGELAAVDGRSRSATLRAVDQVEALIVSAARFSALCRSQPRIAWVLLEVVVGRLRETDRQRVDFGGGTAAQRVHALLLELAVRHGVVTSSGIDIVTRASQQELAAMAATSRESMARVLRDLRERGLVSTRRHHIVIHQLTELRRLAG